MSGVHLSPFLERFKRKLGRELTNRDVHAIKDAFVAAPKEEVEIRFHGNEQPLRIAGLGSFKMKTRPACSFIDPNDITGTKYIPKPPACRLAFSSKWEEIK